MPIPFILSVLKLLSSSIFSSNEHALPNTLIGPSLTDAGSA
jgi:hypothetical protein